MIKIPFSFEYRYLIIGMMSLGIIIAVSYVSVFVLVVTHTTRKNISYNDQTSFYSQCTSYYTSADYISDYDKETGIHFHAVYYLGIFITTIFSGHITSRFPCHRVFGVAVFLSSVLFLLLPTVFEISSEGVFVIRFLQGFLFMNMQPCVVILVSAWAMENEKSTFLSISVIGYFLSPAIASITVGACLCYISWDSAFYIYGTCGILWSIFWAQLAYALPQDCPYISFDELNKLNSDGNDMKRGSKKIASNIPWGEILTCKAVWAIWLANFCKFSVTSTMLAISPLFFLDVFGIRAADYGLLLSLSSVLSSISSLVLSLISDRIIASKRFSITTIRKFMQCVGSLSEAVCFVCMIYADTWQASYLFLLSAFCFGGMTIAGFKSNIIDLSTQYSGAVAAVSTTSIIGAFVATLVCSLVTVKGGTKDNWESVFWMEAAIATITAVIYFLFATSERQPWDGKSDSRYETIPSSDNAKE